MFQQRRLYSVFVQQRDSRLGRQSKLCDTYTKVLRPSINNAVNGTADKLFKSASRSNLQLPLQERFAICSAGLHNRTLHSLSTCYCKYALFFFILDTHIYY